MLAGLTAGGMQVEGITSSGPEKLNRGKKLHNYMSTHRKKIKFDKKSATTREN